LAAGIDHRCGCLFDHPDGRRHHDPWITIYWTFITPELRLSSFTGLGPMVIQFGQVDQTIPAFLCADLPIPRSGCLKDRLSVVGLSQPLIFYGEYDHVQ
jgi:hypothetical protein